MKKRLLIIGGGASGTAAALRAADCAPQAEIIITEGLERIGKKILATGNGRCNLGNRMIDARFYHGGDHNAIAAFLKTMPAEMTESFFRDLGLYCAADTEGRVYPYSRRAATVLDILRMALERRSSVQILCGCTVTGLRRTGDGFLAHAKDGRRIRADAVILATGGLAAPKQGITQIGYTLSEQMGHCITRTAPCLVPLRADHSALRGLKGIRAHCAVTLSENEVPVTSVRGELQFADYGLTGIPALQLSCFLFECDSSAPHTVSIDLLPDLTQEAVLALLRERTERYPEETIEQVFLGLIARRVLYAVMKSADLRPLSRRADSVTDAELSALTRCLKGWRMNITGTLSYEHAQVTGGGVPLCEIDEQFASRRTAGLYLCGETLDVTGNSGGYNLHWAWCSGQKAGEAAGRYLYP